MIDAFSRRTGLPVLVNASLNGRGEPIVCSQVDAYRCFMGTAIDALVIGTCLLLRQDQLPDHPLLGAVFFGILLPVGWVLRRMGWLPCVTRFDADASSYRTGVDPARAVRLEEPF